MNSLNNMLKEVKTIDPRRFSRCIVHYNGMVAEGTHWGYETGGEPFECEISPEQAKIIYRAVFEEIDHRFPSESAFLVHSLPDILVFRGNGFSEPTSSAQVALYDFLV